MDGEHKSVQGNGYPLGDRLQQSVHLGELHRQGLLITLQLIHLLLTFSHQQIEIVLLVLEGLSVLAIGLHQHRITTLGLRHEIGPTAEGAHVLGRQQQVQISHRLPRVLT